MKNFIMMCSLLLILLFFPMQLVREKINHYKMSTFDTIVHKHVQLARIEGYFTTDNINSLKTEIADVMNVAESEIIVNVTTTPKYRTETFDERELIHYEISIPIDRLVAMPEFLGIADTDNQMLYTKKGSVTSEVLPK